MRALRFHDWNSPPVLDEIPDPIRGDGEVLVRVQAAGLSHLDRTVATGTFGLRPDLPYVAGVEGSGVVVDGGEWPPGTQVLLRGGALGLRRNGTWAEYVSAPVKAVSTLSAPLHPAVAATFFQPSSTAAVALRDVAQLQPGECVIVVGASGAVGGQVVQQALRAGASVIAVVGSRSRLELLPAGVDGRAADAENAIADLAANRPATVLVDTTGGAGLAERIRWVAAGGRAVLIGYTAGPAFEIDLPSWLLEDVALLPMNMIRREPRARELAPELAGLLASGQLVLPVESVPPEGVPDALSRLSRGEVNGRVALVW